jgi:hypothetical protein
MDKTHTKVDGNFDVLFCNLKNSKVNFDLAHEIMNKAIIAHYPNQSIIDNVYKRINATLKGKTKQEFSDDWKESISASGKRMFYSQYDIEGSAKEEKKEYGSMSAREYRLQRKHAEEFPLIDWEKIELKPMSEDDIKELENLIKNFGGSNE